MFVVHFKNLYKMKKKSKVYISGQITGLENGVATQLFEEMENRLYSAGYEPVNPIKVMPFDPKHEWIDYMMADIEALFDCKYIIMLPNWQNSKGAKIEHKIAECGGIPIVYPSEYKIFMKES